MLQSTLAIAFDLFVLSLLLFCAPLLGVYMFGGDIREYLVFPWIPERATVAPFNAAFIGVLMLITAAALLSFFSRALRFKAFAPTPAPRSGSFPWWGFLALVSLILSWILAWTRLPAFSGIQIHTYSPLWYSFIVLVNAITMWRSGSCLITGQSAFFFVLFPVSALFWWYFEYLNRFTSNWYYLASGLGVPLAEHLGPFWYAFHSSIAFATVLPAVLSVRELLLTGSPGLFSRFDAWGRLSPGRKTGAALLLFSAANLIALPVFPDKLYPLLWISPGLALTGLRLCTGRPHAFSPAAEGNWGGIAAVMLSALLCGFCWEMWNYLSEAHWIYQVPYAGDFRLFAMPLPGYAGYLPFGIECLAAGLIARELAGPGVQKSAPQIMPSESRPYPIQEVFHASQ